MFAMRWILTALWVLVLCGPLVALQDETTEKKPEINAETGLPVGEPMAEEAPAVSEDDVLYALGMAIAENLLTFDLTEEELGKVQGGLTDGVLGNDPKVDVQEMRPHIQAFSVERRQAAVEKEKMAATAALDEMAAAEGAVRTESGLVFTETQAGDGEHPTAEDRVSVHYHGTLLDGTVFDSSVDRGEPAQFGLRQVVKCWTEGVQMMTVGSKARLACPSDIAYGDRGRPPLIAGGATLIFDVELLEIIRPEAPAEVEEAEAESESE